MFPDKFFKKHCKQACAYRIYQHVYLALTVMLITKQVCNETQLTALSKISTPAIICQRLSAGHKFPH